MSFMEKIVITLMIVFLGLIPKSVRSEASDMVVTNRKLHVVSFVDVGQIHKGSVLTGGGLYEVENVFLNRDGVALVYEGTVNERLRMNIGVGGLFWKPYPEGDQSTKRISFGPGISEASGEYEFGKNKHLKFGYFPYKYNDDALNLGEYLLRCEAYPTIVNTGGWVWMNSAVYQSMGMRYNWNLFDGKFKQDFVMFSEYNETPIYDFSPAYIASYKSGPFELGGGVSLHRWIPVQPSVTTPNQDLNTYVEVDNFPAFPALNDSANNRYQVAFGGGTLKSMEANIRDYTDSAGNNLASLGKDAQGNTYYVIPRGAGKNDTLYPKVRTKLTFKAIEVMGRASLNLNELFGMEESKTGAFKIFSELAVLGVQNQPYFYKSISNRIPIMAGIHLPTFGFLDLLSFQMEYLNNPWPDNKQMQYDATMPIPQLPKNNFALYELEKAKGTYDADNFKWTAYAKKTLFPGLELYCQIANDHFRSLNGFARPTFEPITNSKDHWYYLTRFQWSM